MAFVRRRCGERRVGHAGTLDPFATGVLPVCIGRATRFIEYLVDARKTYRATVRLGIETDTYDFTGTIVAESDAESITRDQVEAALSGFQGEILQTPPAFSAIKRGGVPLYKLARSGQPVTLEPRAVEIYRIELTSWEPPAFEIEVECGKGTYIRSLAHDLGRALGAGAHLAALRRTRVGPFDAQTSPSRSAALGLEAIDIDSLRSAFESGAWQARLLGADEILIDWPAAIIGTEAEARIRHGMPARVQELRAAPARSRAYGLDGTFVGVIRREAPGMWRAHKVL